MAAGPGGAPQERPRSGPPAQLAERGPTRRPPPECRPAGRGGPPARRKLRCRARRLRFRPQVSLAPPAAFSPALAPAQRRPDRPGDGRKNPDPDGPRRNFRPPRRRFPPLQRRPGLAGSPFRKDALRPGHADHGLQRGPGGGPATALRRSGGRHLLLAEHHDAVAAGPFLHRPGCRQRGCRRPLLRLDPGRDRRGP